MAKRMAKLTDHKKRLKQNEPPHDKTNKMTCAPSEGSDQPRHPLRCALNG